MKQINQVPQIEMDTWQVAEHLYGKEAVEANRSLVSRAAQQMRAAGWAFSHYDETYGDEVWSPPGRINL